MYEYLQLTVPLAGMHWWCFFSMPKYTTQISTVATFQTGIMKLISTSAAQLKILLSGLLAWLRLKFCFA